MLVMAVTDELVLPAEEGRAAGELGGGAVLEDRGGLGHGLGSVVIVN
jgi:hypothetical protein